MKRFVRVVIAALALTGVSLAAAPAHADPVNPQLCGQIVGVRVVTDQPLPAFDSGCQGI